MADGACVSDLYSEASLGTNPASDVDVQVREDVNLFGGHANTLEKRVRGHFCHEN